MSARPFTFGFSETGILFEPWGSFGSAEAAWAKKDKVWTEIVAKRWQRFYDGGWFVVINPKVPMQEYEGVGRSAGVALIAAPKYARERGT